MTDRSALPDTLNAAQAAALLFGDVDTIMTLARRGELPGTKIGKSWVFLYEDVIEFLRARVREEAGRRRQPITPDAVLVPRPSSKRRPPPILPALPVKAASLRQRFNPPVADPAPQPATDDCIE